MKHSSQAQWTEKFGPKDEAAWDAFSRQLFAGVFSENMSVEELAEFQQGLDMIAESEKND